MKSDDYITYNCRFLSHGLIQTILLIPSYYSKFISYELAGELNGPIDHRLR